jgi:hypothetical protein
MRQHIAGVLVVILIGLVAVVLDSRTKSLPRTTEPTAIKPTTVPDRMSIKWLDGAYCPRTGDVMYTVRTTWRNDGNRPVRTVYATIRVFDKAGNLTPLGAVDFPIYSVPETHPGVAPGETHHHENGEGYVIQLRIGGPDSPGRVTTEMKGGTEASIK